MILYYIFFEIDGKNYKLCKDKKLYEGSDVVVSEHKEGSSMILDRVKQIIEYSCKYDYRKRISLH